MPGGFTNPFEYREAMYEMFFHGKTPEAKPQPAPAPRPGKGSRTSKPPPPPKASSAAPPRSAIAHLAALGRRAEQLRQERSN